MSFHVLVIGGSYFLGRIFCTLASRLEDTELTLVNRGRYPMNHLPRLTEYRCDRHDAAGLSRLPAAEYDAIVDFCAYSPGDIASLLENLPGTAKRYILLSTADVYARAPGGTKDEASSLLEAPPAGAAGEYTWNKRLLEKELEEICALRGMESVSCGPPSSTGPIIMRLVKAGTSKRWCGGSRSPSPSTARGSFRPCM